MNNVDSVLKSYDEVFCSERGILAGILLCREHQCCGSAVVLAYSAIDNLAFLTMDQKQPDVTGADFRRVVSQYIGSSVGATPDELWAARCGILHCHTAQSRLSREKPHVMKLVYQYGPLQPRRSNIQDWLMVDLDKLIVRLGKAIAGIRKKIHQGKLDPVMIRRRLTQMFNPEHSKQLYEYQVGESS